jgi:hypothetical protein
MKPIHRIGITAMALLLVVAAGATAYHVYETRLSSGYAPILLDAMTSSYEERTAYIHEARCTARKVAFSISCRARTQGLFSVVPKRCQPVSS